MNLYADLGIFFGASDAEIRAAYLSAARQCHPDKNGGSAQSTATFKKLDRAYRVLKDPTRRGHYNDQYRRLRTTVKYSFMAEENLKHKIATLEADLKISQGELRVQTEKYTAATAKVKTLEAEQFRLAEKLAVVQAQTEQALADCSTGPPEM